MVVIGGGIAGVSATYHLAEAGICNVQLVEMHELGSGTTYYTAGWFMLQAQLEENVRLSQLSLSEFLLFKEKFGVDIDFRQTGSLSINTIEHVDEMKRLVDLYGSLGVEVELLPVDEIKSIVPFLSLSDIGGGIFCKQDGVLDTFAVLDAWRKHATRLGAKIDEGIRATDIIVRGGRVVGVGTTHGYISTPTVVNAAGIYDKIVAKWAGVDLPTFKAIRHTLITEPTSLLPRNDVLIEIRNPTAIYIGREGSSAKYSVGLDETDSFAHGPDLLSLEQKYGNALFHRMPELAELRIMKCIAGIRSLPHRTLFPDRDRSDAVPNVGRSLPILGPVDAVEGYINSCAWGGLGVAQSPVGGMLVAGCVTGTNRVALSIEPFLLKRYGQASSDVKA